MTMHKIEHKYIYYSSYEVRFLTFKNDHKTKSHYSLLTKIVTKKKKTKKNQGGFREFALHNLNLFFFCNNKAHTARTLLHLFFSHTLALVLTHFLSLALTL